MLPGLKPFGEHAPGSMGVRTRLQIDASRYRYGNLQHAIICGPLAWRPFGHWRVTLPKFLGSSKR